MPSSACLYMLAQFLSVSTFGNLIFNLDDWSSTAELLVDFAVQS